MKTLAITFFFVTMGAILPACAVCYYNGQPYPTGTQLGSLVCVEDGSWQPARR